MARERPFKAELIEVRKALYRPRVPGSRGPDGVGSSNSADREHLIRWEGDERVEEIWAKFHTLSPTTSPKELISRCLKARRQANAWVARISRSKDWPKQLHRRYAERATNIFSRHKSLSDATAKIGVLFYEMLDATLAVELNRGSLLAEKPPHISRQNKTKKHEDKRQVDNNWRVHRLCMISIGAFWYEQCCRCDDTEVAALTEIAIPGAVIDADQVRNVRRSIKAAATIPGELSLGKIARVHH